MRRILLLFILLTMAACSSGDSGEGSFDNFASAPIESVNTENIALATADAATVGQRVILRNASLTLLVEDPQAKAENISRLAAEYGGWVVSSNMQTLQAQRRQATVQIRIPAEQLDQILTIIKGDVLNVEAETVTGTDVTQEYTDLNSQLINLQAAEAQLQTLMEDAENTDAVLSVYDELVRIRGEIGTITGRINYYDEASSFASINVTLRSEVVAIAEDEDVDWQPGETVETAVNLLGNVMRVLVDTLIFLVIVGIPLLIAVGIPSLLIYRLFNRLRHWWTLHVVDVADEPGWDNETSPEDES